MKKLLVVTVSLAALALLSSADAPLQAQLLAGGGLLGVAVACRGLAAGPRHDRDEELTADFFDVGVHTLVRR